MVVIRGDFGGVVEDVRHGQEFERQWKGREIVTRLVQGQYSDPELTKWGRGWLAERRK